MSLNKLKKYILKEIKLLKEQQEIYAFEGDIGPNSYPVYNGISQIWGCYQPSGQSFDVLGNSISAAPNPLAIGIGECGRVNVGCPDNFGWSNQISSEGSTTYQPFADQIGLIENPEVPYSGQPAAIFFMVNIGGSMSNSGNPTINGLDNPCCNDNGAAPNDCVFGCRPGSGTQLYNYWNPINVTAITQYGESPNFCGDSGYGPMADFNNTFFQGTAYSQGLARWSTMIALFGSGYTFYPDLASCEAACIPENAPEGYELEGCMDQEAINYNSDATIPASLALPWGNIANDSIQETSGGCEYEIECWRCGFAPGAQAGDPSTGPMSQMFTTTQPPFFWSSEEGYNVEYYQNNPQLGIIGFGCKEFGQVYSQNPENLNCNEIEGPTDALEDLPFDYDLDNDGVADITPIKTSEYEDLWKKEGCDAFEEFIDMINGFTSYQVPEEISIQEAKIIFCKRCETIEPDGLIGFPDIKETWCSCCPSPERPMEPELDDTIDPINPPRYRCDITTSLGTCVEDPSGPFFSLDACENSGCEEGTYQGITPLPDNPQLKRMQELAGINPEKK